MPDKDNALGLARAAVGRLEAECDELQARVAELADRLLRIYREANDGTDDAHRRLVTIMSIAAPGDDDAR